VSATAADWWVARHEHQLAILMHAETHALSHVASAVIREQEAEIERLRGELDGYQGRSVLFCTEAQMAAAAMSSLDEPDGTVLRATDTGRELVLSGRTWTAR
jgi:hypothetical protein